MSLVGALLGSYRITDELSSGGMGTIYRARHELLGRDAAVKVLRAELTEDPELVDRFFTEARAATAIRHPEHHRGVRLRLHRSRRGLPRDGVSRGRDRCTRS